MSIDTSADAAPSRANALLRTLALTLGFAEITAFILFASLMLPDSDPLGSAIGHGVTLLMGLPIALLVLPGTYLAWNRQWLGPALGLVVLALPLGAYLWLTA